MVFALLCSPASPELVFRAFSFDAIRMGHWPSNNINKNSKCDRFSYVIYRCLWCASMSALICQVFIYWHARSRCVFAAPSHSYYLSRSCIVIPIRWANWGMLCMIPSIRYAQSSSWWRWRTADIAGAHQSYSLLHSFVKMAHNTCWTAFDW